MNDIGNSLQEGSPEPVVRLEYRTFGPFVPRVDEHQSFIGFAVSD
jgi:hypothetical protein